MHEDGRREAVTEDARLDRGLAVGRVERLGDEVHRDVRSAVVRLAQVADVAVHRAEAGRLRIALG